VADLFDMQDEIVARLANQLGTQLIAAEARQAEKVPHLNSMDFYFQGQDCLNKGVSTLMQARAFLKVPWCTINSMSTLWWVSHLSICIAQYS
jgi:hypothetical protein